jgi:NAD(P)-dependent dehydrogenase (short-subunit alcohol dehydrogenase family)
MKLSGRTCVVTGASGGFGGRLAVKFWKEGASLLVTGRKAQALKELADSLPRPLCPGQKVFTFPADLSTATAALEIISAAREHFDSLTVLVNNAAVQGPIGPLWENSREEWERAIRVDLLAPVQLSAQVVPWMLSEGYGKIINISGGGAASHRAYFSAYACAKAALVRLTETLAEETKANHIDVNALAPGVLNTNMTRQVIAAGPASAGLSEYEKLRGQKDTELTFNRAVDLATFLASSDSDGITGRLISAVWDRWESLGQRRSELEGTDVYTLRRIVPKDRGLDWD